MCVVLPNKTRGIPLRTMSAIVEVLIGTVLN